MEITQKPLNDTISQHDNEAVFYANEKLKDEVVA